LFIFAAPPLHLCTESFAILNGNQSAAGVIELIRPPADIRQCELLISELKPYSVVFFTIMEVKSTEPCVQTSRMISIGKRILCRQNDARMAGGVRVDVEKGQASVRVVVNNPTSNTGVTTMKLYYIGECCDFSSMTSF